MEADRPVLTIRPLHGWFKLQLGEVFEYRELLFFLAWRDIKVRYKQTLIGTTWVILQPLLAMAILNLIFSRFQRFSPAGVSYSVYVLTALIPWQFFHTAVAQATNRVVDDANLVSKTYFPRILIPMSAILAKTVDFGIGLLVLFAFLLFQGIVPSAAILYLPAFILLTIGACLGIGLWLSALNVRFRDVRYVVPFLMQVWFFCSPVIYTADLVPENWRWLYGLNPVVSVLNGFRWSLLGTQEISSLMVALSLAMVVFFVITGLVFFQRMSRSFADII